VKWDNFLRVLSSNKELATSNFKMRYHQFEKRNSKQCAKLKVGISRIRVKENEDFLIGFIKKQIEKLKMCSFYVLHFKRIKYLKLDG
jgi:hypothetical protein